MKKPKPTHLDDLTSAPVPDLPPKVDEEIRSAEADLSDLLLGPVRDIPPEVEADGGRGTPPSSPTSPHTAPPPGRGPTPSITIRMPQHIIDAYRDEAARRGLKYQELMKLVLGGTATGW